MNDLDFLLDRFRAKGAAPALAWRGETLNYAGLADMVEERIRLLEGEGIGLGTPVILLGDFSFVSVALLLALIARRAIAIPLTPTMYQVLGEQSAEVGAEFVLDARAPEVAIERRGAKPPNELYQILIERRTCGLVLFTSGSTGRPKAVVHDFSRLLEKFRMPRPAMVAVNFLLFDHWGGINTLLGSLANGGLMVLPVNRNPDDICTLIERYRIELLPATPSFLNLLLISRSYERADLSSLKLITYGAETMPQSTLQRLREAFPQVELRQTYGMIELGVMRAKSKSSDSLWVKLGGEGYQLRVVDGILQIKADAAMLGYLNAPSPFTDDGYLITGDRVEQEGDYLKILGRDSDLINVGGQKVYPAEVETTILEIPEVVDAVVYGEKHILTGKIVCADIVPADGVDATELRQRIKQHCAAKLQPFMVPVRVNFPKEGIYTGRLKRRRDR
jgi:acyl-coenzyme A synthetase/AMP-(fatty) acid ligase